MDVVEFAAGLTSEGERSEGVARWAENFLGTAAQQILYLAQFIGEMSESTRTAYVSVLSQALAKVPDNERLLLPTALREDLSTYVDGSVQTLIEVKTRRGPAVAGF